MSSLIFKYDEILKEYKSQVISKFKDDDFKLYAEYLAAFKLYKKENSTEFIEEFFLNCAISRMEKEIEEKKNLTKNFLDRFLKK